MKFSAIIIFLQATIIVAFILSKGCDHSVPGEIHQAMEDSLQKTKDHLGRERAQRLSMTGTIQDLKNQLVARSESEKNLLAEVKKYQKALVAATSVVIETKDTSSGRVVSVPKDTICKDSTSYIYMANRCTIKKPWVQYEVYTDNDSCSVIADIKNSIDFNYHYERYSWIDSTGRRRRDPFWKKKKLYGDVFNQNPNTGVKEMTSFHVEEKKKYTGLKILFGILGGIAIDRLYLK